MGWATTGYIAKLQHGETVTFRPRGDSMSPRIKSGDLCTVEPVEPSQLRDGDIVLCRVRGADYLHLVKALQGTRFQIGNNHGHVNGWIGDDLNPGRPAPPTRVELSGAELSGAIRPDRVEPSGLSHQCSAA